MKCREPQLLCGAGYANILHCVEYCHCTSSVCLPLVRGSLLSAVSQTLLQGCLLVSSLLSFSLCKAWRQSQLPETKDIRAIK